jgi:hypothetical protein
MTNELSEAKEEITKLREELRIQDEANEILTVACYRGLERDRELLRECARVFDNVLRITPVDQLDAMGVYNIITKLKAAGYANDE